MPPEPATFRTVQVSTSRLSDVELEVSGRLVDELAETASTGRPAGQSSRREIHDLRLTLRLRYPELEIVDAAAELVVAPFPDCQSVPPVYRKLVGLRIGEGFIPEVQKR